MSIYFYTNGVEKYGPFSKEELCNQKISRATKVWCYGMDNWTELYKVPELINVINSIPSEIDSKPPNEDVAISYKPKTQLLEDEETKLPHSKEKKKSSSFIKWASIIIVIVLISLFAYKVIQNQLDLNQYNEVVTNSYDSNEDFDIYVNKFYRDLASYGIYPKKAKVQIIKFSRLDQLDNMTHFHGISLGVGDDSRIEIYINPSTWQRFNKQMRYILMYHELAHDVLNLDDLEAESRNEGKLMYPSISNYEKKTMDDFIESTHALFEEQSD